MDKITPSTALSLISDYFLGANGKQQASPIHVLIENNDVEQKCPRKLMDVATISDILRHFLLQVYLRNKFHVA